jgi:hypothetical protein
VLKNFTPSAMAPMVSATITTMVMMMLMGLLVGSS